ncbi:MAG: hypothetical protein J6Q62_00070 [Alistipes sp.]|nr:hypothetical protein [Alistipes sp.]
MTLYEQRDYLTPEIEVLYIVVEQGFVGSTGQLPEYEEDDDEIILG